MNKENNRSAAGLRRSAVAERLRLREEWLELKGTDVPTTSRKNVLTKKRMNPRCTPIASGKKWCQKTVRDGSIHKEPHKPPDSTSDALRGVVALVEVGAETKALPLRAALAALGATVVSSWSPLVTHLVWTDGGCRGTRGRARALGCRLVSPRWVQACARAHAKLSEGTFPTAARHSDLPSPRTLRQLLKRAEMENMPLVDLLSDSKEDDSNGKLKPLRISTDTEQDTSADKTTDTSNDTIDVESRVNTAPRRALPTSMGGPSKSRRKLFTQKEAQLVGGSSDEESDNTTKLPTQKRVRVQHRPAECGKIDLAKAQRMAKRILASCTSQATRSKVTQTSLQYRIVFTGMSRTERQTVTKAIHELNGRIQNHVTKRTTHVLLGACRNENPNTTTATSHCDLSGNTCSRNNNISNSKSNKTLNDTTGVKRHDDLTKNTSYRGRNLPYITGVTIQCDLTTNSNETLYTNNRNGALFPNNGYTSNRNGDLQRNNGCPSDIPVTDSIDKKARTLNALHGAARGCRVLHARWAIDSADAGKWLHHHGYEVHHLRKICQKARVERTALGRTHSEYAYDVFNGMRIHITPNAEQRDAATLLLKLCGAIVHEEQDGGRTQDGGRAKNGGRTQDGGRAQNGGRTQDGGRPQFRVNSDCDITIGVDVDQVCSKWVFDSVAVARIRTTRRYINTANLALSNR